MKIGILGSGMIVASALDAINSMKNVECMALWHREVDSEGATSLQNQYNIPKLYTDIDEFLKDDSFDVVYVGLINSLHYEYTKKAIEANKNVICEKPFTPTYRHGKALVELAKEKNLFLFEAIMLRYADNYEEIARHLNELGEITLIQCNYSQYSSRFDKYLKGIVLPAFSPELSGGSLYDINLYCIQFTIGLFGKPEKVHYMANIGHNGIDTSGILCMDYGKYKAICVGAKDSDSPARCTIQGHKGYIDMLSLPGKVEHVNLHLKGQEPRCIDIKDLGNPMLNEFNKIDQIINNKDYDRCYQYMDITLDVMKVLEDARMDAGIHFNADNEGL